jgi:hypothetical protein
MKPCRLTWKDGRQPRAGTVAHDPSGRFAGAFMQVPNACDVPTAGSKPTSARRFLTSGYVVASAIPSRSKSTITFGVPAGATATPLAQRFIDRARKVAKPLANA